MHITDKLKLDLEGAWLPPDYIVRPVDKPFDPAKGLYMIDIFKGERHVAVCIWNDTQKQFAIDLICEHPSDGIFENPRYAEPFWDTTGDVGWVLATVLVPYLEKHTS